MRLCKNCEYFHIRMEYENEYNWGTAECKKHNLVTDFRSKKKFETLSCIEDEAAWRKTEPEVEPISYKNCCDAMLMMWIGNVLTDDEYNRIMDKLNAFEMKRRVNRQTT